MKYKIGLWQTAWAWWMLYCLCAANITNAMDAMSSESVCLHTLKQSLQAVPAGTTAATATPVALLCAPLQDGSNQWVALAVLPAASTAQDQRAFYDLFWLVLNPKLQPVAKQWLPQFIRSQHATEPGAWLRVEIDTTPYWLHSTDKSIFGVRSFYRSPQCQTCTTPQDKVLLDLFYTDGSQIRRAVEPLVLLQQATAPTACEGSKLWTEILPTFTTGAAGYPNLIVTSYQARLSGKIAPDGRSCAEDEDSTEFKQRRYELQQHQLQEIAPEAWAAKDSDDPCDNGAFGKMMLSRFSRNNPQQVLCKTMPEDAESAIVAVFTPSSLAGKFDAASGDGDLDLHVFQIDYWGDIKAEAFFPSVAYTDAYELTNLQIDTAPYLLAPGKRAFAVRSFNSNQRCTSCNATQNIERFDLFLIAEQDIRWMLRDIRMQHATAEIICTKDHRPEIRTSTLAIGQQVHQGFFDLRLTTQIEPNPGTDPQSGQRCRAPAPTRYEIRDYQFDGEQYRATGQPPPKV